MSPMFHKHDDDQSAGAPATDPALEAEVTRLSALTLPQLAAEILTKAYTPQYDPTDAVNDLDGIASSFWDPPQETAFNHPVATTSQLVLRDLVAEGVQVLEQALLLRLETHYQGDYFNAGYVTTRLGRDALQRNTVAQVLGA